MENKFTLVINPGRSGSSFLYNVFKKNFDNKCHVFHESLHSCITQPKKYNRCYQSSEINEILKDERILAHLKYFDELLKTKPVIECGWTFSHLAPVLAYYFKNKFRYIILHRDPISFAASRSTMGNYHPNSFYKDKSHEVSPFDEKSMFKSFQPKWNSMNPFEKCLFWWLESVSEALEFHEKYSDGNGIIISSDQLFKQEETISRIVDLTGVNASGIKLNRKVNKNPLHPWTLESFPLRDTYKNWNTFPEIVTLMEYLEYNVLEFNLEKNMLKYQVPRNIVSLTRSHAKYWFIKNKLKDLIRSLFTSNPDYTKDKQ